MASACDHAHQIERHWDVSLMGPFSEQKQLERADSIKRLLETNPQMDDYMKSIWKKHAMNITFNEEEYNRRVKTIYCQLQPRNKGWVTYE